MLPTLVLFFVLLSLHNIFSQNYVFNFKGSAQTFTVPDGVEILDFEVVGASGEAKLNTGNPGRGAVLKGKIVVSSGQVLSINVGGRGGYNGGGVGGSGTIPAGSGGGASDIRLSSVKLIVAGGGGGGGGLGTALSHLQGPGKGGAGGSASASGGDGLVTSYVIQTQSGYYQRATWGEVNQYSAKGGTVWAGGAGGTFGYSGYAGSNGSSSSGGKGASGSLTSSGGGGGGGGGYFGGGGGAVGSAFTNIPRFPGAGGGAGSSFAHSDLTALVQITTASSVSDGYVMLTTSTRIPQTISNFQITGDRILGIPFSLPNLTASSGLPVLFSVLSGNGTISGNNFTPLNLGNTTLRASTENNAFYSPVNADATFQVVDADSDADGLLNSYELSISHTDPQNPDSDSDGINDGSEVNTYRTNPLISDTDGDGLNDGSEISIHKTDPLKADTDGDGLSDGAEVNTHKTNPLLADTDGDGLTDRAEVNTHNTDPLKVDTDGDGLSDGDEVNTHRTNPLKSDTDGDGLSDGVEVNTHKTDPLKADTDGDGFTDLHEVLNLKSDPLAFNDVPSFTSVANARNPDEDNAGYDAENAGVGYVGQDYKMAVTEVTNLMYARFLNAVARTDSLYGLYSTLMGTDPTGGIVRSGSSGSYTYTVKSGFVNKPINFVSLFDTLRYINWLHNGMPTTQVQDETTTENGAYKLLGSNPRQVVRNFAAKYFLPDQDEWHKAAFFDPAPGGGLPSDSYWPYADQTTTGPGGNFGAERTAIVSTSAGASHYGTYDQGGNVWEWTETVVADERRLISQGQRPMSATPVTQESADLGFRVGKSVLRAEVSPVVIPAVVPVGEAYNLGDDMANSRGAVAYDFQIGTYEVTNEEYAAFLNAVAKTDSFYGLYNTRMGSDAQGGITRSGSNGSYVYTVKSGFARKPVNFVTAYNAMRFCNWLHNGAQPDGDTESGAYRLLGNIPTNTTVLRRSAGARYYLPTEDEWYKAAFYDPSIAAMLTGNYWAYAVKSDAASGSTINFGGAFGGLSDVATPGYPSYFGTYGQSGNAAEWTETLSGTARIVRGGHYASAVASVSYAGFISPDPSSVSANVGFRIAAARAVQTIAAFAPIGEKTFGDAPFTVSAPVASSGLPVSISVKSGPATISDNTVTITGAGTVVLAANQAGDLDYDEATERTVEFSVSKRSQAIAPFDAVPDKNFGSLPFSIMNPASSSGLTVAVSVKSGPATISSNVVTLTGVGTVVLAANQAGNENFSQAPEVTLSFSVFSFDAEFNDWLGRHPSMNAQKRGLSDDADGDGMSNLMEFAMDLDPSSSAAVERISPVVSGNELRLIFNRRKDHAALGLQIYAETSDTLVADSWTQVGVVERVISSSDSTETIQAVVPIQSDAKKFLRVRVIK